MSNTQTNTGSADKLRRSIFNCKKRKNKECECPEPECFKANSFGPKCTRNKCNKGEKCKDIPGKTCRNTRYKNRDGKGDCGSGPCKIPATYECHHIRPHGEFSHWTNKKALDALEQLEDQFTDAEVDVDSCENGVCLDFGRHKGLHTQAYVRAIAEQLEGAKTKEDIDTALIKIKKMLYDGTFTPYIDKFK